MIFDSALDILFPKLCIGCGEEGRYICDKCSIFPSENYLICPVCRQKSFSGETHFKCRRKYFLDGLISVWDYDGIIKYAVRCIKQDGAFDIAKELTENSLAVIFNDSSKRFNSFLSFSLAEETAITFVPMLKREENKRGFNQSQIIANAIAKILNKKEAPFLRKTENGIKLNKIVSPEDMVLVGDVFASGATMKECCRVLKQNGARRIWGFAIARSDQVMAGKISLAGG